MQHGTVNEHHAVATLAGIVLPVLHLCYYEEGAYVVSNSSGEPMFIVSPDGRLRLGEESPVMAIEIKCPYPADFKPSVHYTLPERYVTQVLAEMYALGSPSCYI